MLWRLADELPMALVEASPDGEVLVSNVRAREVLEGPGRVEVYEALRRVCARAHRSGELAEQALSIGRMGEVRLVAAGGGPRLLVSIELSPGTRLRTEIRVLREYIAAVADPAVGVHSATRLLGSLASALSGSTVAYYLVDEGVARLQSVAGAPLAYGVLPSTIPLQPAAASVARAVATSQPVFVHALGHSPFAIDRGAGAPSLSGLAVPVKAEKRVRGAIWVVGPPHLLGEGELRLVQALTDALGELLWRSSRETALARERGQARELIDDLQDALVEFDGQATVIRAGGNTFTVFGRDPPALLGARLTDWIAPADLAGLVDGGAPNGPGRPPLNVRGPEGRTLRCAIDRIGADPDGTIRIVVRDLTERLELEERMRRERDTLIRERQLATVGRLAAGVAHEVNNPLTYVRVNLQLLREQVGQVQQGEAGVDPSALGTTIDEALEGVERIGGIVHALKGMSRDRMRDWRVFDVREPVDGAVVMFRATRSDCSVEVSVGQLPAVDGSPGALTQVLLNLLANGADAMGGRGTLRVVGDATSTEVTLAVADQGTGFTPEAKARLFEPFFTTKDAGRGTGLGLHVSRQLVAEMRGRIDVQPGTTGTIVRVTLPVSRSATIS